MSIVKKHRTMDIVLFIILILLAAIFLAPLLIVLMNSFKSKFFISSQPFKFPTAETFTGRENYIEGARSNSSTPSATRSSSRSSPSSASLWPPACSRGI